MRSTLVTIALALTCLSATRARRIEPNSTEGSEIETLRQQALMAGDETDNATDRLITRLVDAAMNVEPGRRDIGRGLQRAEHMLLRQLRIRP